MHNHPRSDTRQTKSKNEPQIWETDEAHPQKEDDCSKDPTQKWYFKPILPQVKWKEVGELLALVAAFAVCVIYWNQLDVMSHQLREMQGTSSQTSQLIVNAAHQAEKTKDVAEAASRVSDAAKDFSISAKGINSETMSAVQQFKSLSDTAQSSLKITQNSFRDDQRAWVGTLGNYPFSFKVGEVGSFSTFVMNSGKTPAIHVKVLFTAKEIPKDERITFTYPPALGLRSNTVILPGANSKSLSR